MRWEDLYVLDSKIDLHRVTAIMDPCCGKSLVRKYFQRSHRVCTNDLNSRMGADSCEDALDVGTYWQRKASTHDEVIISDPPAMVLDLLLPIWRIIAKFFVCVRIPSTYMLSPPTPRAHFLQALEREGCLDVFPIYMNGKRDPVYIWMVLYKHPAISVALRPRT